MAESGESPKSRAIKGRNRLADSGTTPLVSIIIPVFNREELICRTLDAVKAQKFRPLEVIIVDDGSSDRTAEVVGNWANVNQSEGFLVRLCRQDNEGAPSARNLGIRESTGLFVQFLDSDDYMHPEKIQIQVEKLSATGADLAVCDFRYVYQAADTLIKDVKNDGDLCRRLERGHSVFIMTPLISASLLDRGIEWDRLLQRQQDMDFMFKVFAAADSYVYTQGVWCDYVKHSGAQISDQYSVKRPQYLRRVRNLISFANQNFKHLGVSGVAMCFSGALNILFKGLMYGPKSFIKKMLGESASAKLKSLLGKKF